MSGIATFILARKNSKRIPGKNMIPFLGRPLVEWSILFARKLEYPVYVFTDFDEVRAIARQHGCFVRDKMYENENGVHYTGMELEIYNHEVKADHIVLLQPTSPLRDYEVIKSGIEQYFIGDYDCVFSVKKNEKPIYTKEGLPLNFTPSYNRQCKTYEETGSFYMFKRQQIAKNHITVGDMLMVLDKYGVDINTMEDVTRAEQVYGGNHGQDYI